jgi:hypothetical protein
MKQLEDSLETHKFYVEMLDICSVSYSANINAMHLWLTDVGYGLWNSVSEGTVALEGDIPDPSHIPIWSHMEKCPGI